MPIALDPKSGGRCISGGALAMADIIVTTAPGPVSAGIRVGTLSEVSHAAVYIGGNRVVEAEARGVQNVSLARSLKNDCLAVAYRHPTLSLGQAAKVREFLLKQVGKGYDYIGVSSHVPGIGPALKISAQVIGQNNDKFFCSELVAAAYEYAGAPLTDGPAVHVTPAAIVRVKLKYVGHLKTPASAFGAGAT